MKKVTLRVVVEAILLGTLGIFCFLKGDTSVSILVAYVAYKLYEQYK